MNTNKKKIMKSSSMIKAKRPATSQSEYNLFSNMCNKDKFSQKMNNAVKINRYKENQNDFPEIINKDNKMNNKNNKIFLSSCREKSASYKIKIENDNDNNDNQENENKIKNKNYEDENEEFLDELSIVENLWEDLGITEDYQTEFKLFLKDIQDFNTKLLYLSLEKKSLRNFRDVLLKLSSSIASREKNISLLKKNNDLLENLALQQETEEIQTAKNNILKDVINNIKGIRINSVNIVNIFTKLREISSFYISEGKININKINKSYYYNPNNNHNYLSTMNNDVLFLNNSEVVRYLDIDNSNEKNNVFGFDTFLTCFTGMFFAPLSPLPSKENGTKNIQCSKELDKAINKCRYIIAQDYLLMKMKKKKFLNNTQNNKSLSPFKVRIKKKYFCVNSKGGGDYFSMMDKDSSINNINNNITNKSSSLGGINLNSNVLFYLKQKMGNSYNGMFIKSHKNLKLNNANNMMNRNNNNINQNDNNEFQFYINNNHPIDNKKNIIIEHCNNSNNNSLYGINNKKKILIICDNNGENDIKNKNSPDQNINNNNNIEDKENKENNEKEYIRQFRSNYKEIKNIVLQDGNINSSKNNNPSSKNKTGKKNIYYSVPESEKNEIENLININQKIITSENASNEIDNRNQSESKDKNEIKNQNEKIPTAKNESGKNITQNESKIVIDESLDIDKLKSTSKENEAKPQTNPEKINEENIEENIDGKKDNEDSQKKLKLKNDEDNEIEVKTDNNLPQEKEKNDDINNQNNNNNQTNNNEQNMNDNNVNNNNNNQIDSNSNNYIIDYYRDNLQSFIEMIKESMKFEDIPLCLKKTLNITEEIYNKNNYLLGINPRILIIKNKNDDNSNDNNKISGVCSFYYMHSNNNNDELIIKINMIFAINNWEDQLSLMMNYIQQNLKYKQIIIDLPNDTTENIENQEDNNNNNVLDLFIEKLKFVFINIEKDNNNLKQLSYINPNSINDNINDNQNNFSSNLLSIISSLDQNGNNDNNNKLIIGNKNNKYFNNLLIQLLKKYSTSQESIKEISDKVNQMNNNNNNIVINLNLNNINDIKNILSEKKIDNIIIENFLNEPNDNNNNIKYDTLLSKIDINPLCSMIMKINDYYYNKMSLPNIKILKYKNYSPLYLLPTKNDSISIIIGEINDNENDNDNNKNLFINNKKNLYDNFNSIFKEFQTEIFDNQTNIFIPSFKIDSYINSNTQIDSENNQKITYCIDEFINFSLFDENPYIKDCFRIKGDDYEVKNSDNTNEKNIFIENDFLFGIINKDLVNISDDNSVLQLFYITKDNWISINS